MINKKVIESIVGMLDKPMDPVELKHMVVLYQLMLIARIAKDEKTFLKMRKAYVL